MYFALSKELFRKCKKRIVPRCFLNRNKTNLNLKRTKFIFTRFATHFIRPFPAYVTQMLHYMFLRHLVQKKWKWSWLAREWIFDSIENSFYKTMFKTFKSLISLFLRGSLKKRGENEIERVSKINICSKWMRFWLLL